MCVSTLREIVTDKERMCESERKADRQTEKQRQNSPHLSSGRVRLLVMRGNPDGAPSWSRSFSSQGKLSPTSLSTDLHTDIV